MTSPKDLKLKGENFCKMKEDIVGNRIPKNIHEAAGKIVEAYSDYIDGSLSFFFNTLIDLMDFLLTADPNYYANLPPELINSHFFNTSTHFKQI